LRFGSGAPGDCCLCASRDLSVQLAGHDVLKAQGIILISASAPDDHRYGYKPSNGHLGQRVSSAIPPFFDKAARKV